VVALVASDWIDPEEVAKVTEIRRGAIAKPTALPSRRSKAPNRAPGPSQDFFDLPGRKVRAGT